ncbi:MAG: ABC transporter substrate-binding protein [Clostridiales bacterium]|jgi:iron complex transport system substrate-binding protein|nr:ABC transporter substrate-binding protein [Clostridiales bacterium]
MRNKILAVAIAFVLLLGACRSNSETELEPTPSDAAASADNAPMRATLSITDLADNAVIVPSAPKRVISLSPTVTEIFYALDCANALIGADEMSDYPGAAANLTRYDASDIAAIIKTAPDLVLTGQGFSENDAAQLRAADISVACGEAATYDDYVRGIVFVAQVMGVDATFLTDVQANISDIYAREKNYEQMNVLLVTAFDGVNITSSAPGAFFGNITNTLGCNSLSDTLGASFPISRLRDVDEPQLILITNDVNYQLFIETEGVKELGAVQGGRVYPVDAALMTRAGPRVDEALLTLFDMFEQAALS